MLLGVLPAPSEPLSTPSHPLHLDRRVAGAGAIAVIIAAMCPPMLAAVGHHGDLEAAQFALLGLVAPALVALSAPAGAVSSLTKAAERLAAGRRRHPGPLRSAGFLALEVGVLIAWRLPPAVDAIASQRAFVVAELASLVPVGIAFWLELVDSPPLASRLGPTPARALLAALAMWSVWIFAYLAGFSAGFYPSYSGARLGAGAAATEQQLTSGLLWLAAALVFLPVVFLSLYHWLQDEERPDAELRRLVREERRRGLSRALGVGDLGGIGSAGNPVRRVGQ